NIDDIPPPTHVADAYLALRALAQDSRIDVTRAAVIGFSKGGQGALYATFTQVQKTWGKELRFAAHVAAYPPCVASQRTVSVTDAPLLLLAAEIDEREPTALCVAWGQKLQAAGHQVEVKMYPGTRHSWETSVDGGIGRSAGLDLSNCKLDILDNGDFVN